MQLFILNNMKIETLPESVKWYFQNDQYMMEQTHTWVKDSVF